VCACDPSHSYWNTYTGNFFIPLSQSNRVKMVITTSRLFSLVFTDLLFQFKKAIFHASATRKKFAHANQGTFVKKIWWLFRLCANLERMYLFRVWITYFLTLGTMSCLEVQVKTHVKTVNQDGIVQILEWIDSQIMSCARRERKIINYFNFSYFHYIFNRWCPWVRSIH
jgi:hypothetical protein